eukprot:COSAG02_NODE_583_length_20010_cov_4.434584_12_plen_237_part_00
MARTGGTHIVRCHGLGDTVSVENEAVGPCRAALSLRVHVHQLLQRRLALDLEEDLSGVLSCGRCASGSLNTRPSKVGVQNQNCSERDLRPYQPPDLDGNSVRVHIFALCLGIRRVRHPSRSSCPCPSAQAPASSEQSVAPACVSAAYAADDCAAAGCAGAASRHCPAAPSACRSCHRSNPKRATPSSATEVRPHFVRVRRCEDLPPRPRPTKQRPAFRPPAVKHTPSKYITARRDF